MKKGLQKAKASLIVGATMAMSTVASAAPIDAPDMGDAIGSVTAVFGATLALSALVFGFKQIRRVL